MQRDLDPENDGSLRNGGHALAMDRLNFHLAAMLEDRRRQNEEVVLNLIPSTANNSPHMGKSLNNDLGQMAEGGLSGQSQAVACTSDASHGDKTGLPPKNARWGVSEGGIDGVGWVRNLVRLSESTFPAIGAAAGFSPRTAR